MTADSAESTAGSAQPTAVPPETPESIEISRLRDEIAAMRETLGKPKAAERTTSRWAHARTIILSAVVVLLVGRIAQLTLTETIALQPISVPQSLVDSGYTPEVAARHLDATMREICASLRTATGFVSSVQAASVLDTIEVPQSKLSLGTVVELIRYLTGQRPTTVQGRIVREGDDLRLVVQILPAHESIPVSNSFVVHGTDPSPLFADAAHFILRVLDPYKEGIYLCGSGRYSEAVFLARQAMHARGCDRKNRSMLYVLLGRVLILQGENGAADGMYRQAVAFDPKNRIARLNWSNLLVAEHKPAAAMEQIQALLNDNAADADAVLASGDVQEFGNHNDAAAEAAYRRAANLDPFNWRAQDSLGSFCYAHKRFAEGSEHFRAAIAIDPTSPYPYMTWAVALELAGDHVGAIQFATRAQSLAPRDPYTYMFLARVIDGMEDKKRAEVWLPVMKANIAEDGDALLAVAALEESLDRHDDALATTARARDLYPRRADVWCLQGAILARHEQLDDAEAHYRKAVELDPHMLIALIGLGDVLYAKGNLDEAETRYRAALQIDPNSPEASQGLENCRKKRNQG
jgi:tetratricopeptide (TPR) repeat protein